MEKMETMENKENMENMENMENVQNVQNIKNTLDTHSVSKVVFQAGASQEELSSGSQAKKTLDETSINHTHQD